MAMSLFSIFDPSGKMIFNNWQILFILIFILPQKMFNNLYIYFIKNVFLILMIEASQSLKFKFSSSVYLSVFFSILIFNLSGLLSYILALPSHLTLSLTLSMVTWTSIMMFGVFKRLWILLSHLVPYGCPFLLMFFMVLIESVSVLIRPITLAVRLTANIMAGHVILALISSVSLLNLLNFLLSFLIQVILMSLETAVAIVQPYVFFTLLSLYKSEL